MPTWPFSTSSSSRTPGAAARVNSSTDQIPTTVASSPRDETRSPPHESDETQSRNPATSPRRTHVRSLSSSLPAIFGGAKKKSSGDDVAENAGVGYGGNIESAPSPKRKTQNLANNQRGRQNDVEMEAGSCATCGSRIKWPKGVTEFRCSTCLMINDLKPSKRRTTYRRDRQVASPGEDSNAGQDLGESGTLLC